MKGINTEALRQGQRRALAKAITLVESKLETHAEQAQELLADILPHTGNSIRIGITGIPGVGKSTFIEAFGQHLIAQGHSIAVLAVDPSSPIAGGSIMGDKTRMEALSRHQRAFIRPSPSEGSLGGVAQKTRESLMLCEAAGYDVILVETVGVGQSEFEVAGMVDFFMVLMLPNAGDELQGIKKGIMELADALVINKADGDSINLAQETQAHYRSAMRLLSHSSFWTPEILTCSSLHNEGVEAVWNMIGDYQRKAKGQGAFAAKRAKQNRQWLHKLIRELLDNRFRQNPEVREQLVKYEAKVVSGEITPLQAAKNLIALL